MKRLLPYIVPFALLGTILGLYIWIPEPLESVRIRFFDTFEHLKPREYTPAPVRIIDVDETTLEKYGQWPWPRTLIAKLVQSLHDAGASVISFDILFAEADRTSPKNILPFWPDTPETLPLKAAQDKLPDHDAILGDTIAGVTAVTSFSLHPIATGKSPALTTGFSFAGDDPRQFLPNFPGAITSLAELESRAKGNAVVNYFPEFDGVIRRIPLLFQHNGKLYPQFAMESVRLLLKAKGYIVKSSGASGEWSVGHKSGIVAVKVGDRIVPTDKRGRFWLYDSGIIPERTIPAWKVMDHAEGIESIRGAITLIGTSAIGLKDLRATPLTASVPGVELHAQVAEQILNGDFLQRPDWAEGAEFLFLFVAGSLLILIMPLLGAGGSAAAGIASIAGIFAFAWHCFASRRLLVDPLIPSLGCLVIYLASSLIHFLKTDSEKRQIRGAFSRYLSPSIVAELARNPDRLKLGGDRRDMTVCFADIRGFTTLSETFEPEELTHFINRFLTPMTQIILEERGTIDKYMGDCIMAFWNAPVDDPDHASHACRAALRMQSGLKELNETRRRESSDTSRAFQELRVGVGLNSGFCCVGNMGSDQRFDYSVLGDTVNLASRLESLSKDYDLDILAGENTQQEARGFTFLELDLVQVKGKTRPSKVFALLGEEGLSGDGMFSELLIRHQALLTAYRSQKWEEALHLAEELGRMPVLEGKLAALYALYQKRIRHFMQNSPGKDWNGAAIAAVK